MKNLLINFCRLFDIMNLQFLWILVKPISFKSNAARLYNTTDNKKLNLHNSLTDGNSQSTFDLTLHNN